ncbi:protein FAM188B [Biomphalaria pfeifferi]|uniref:Ubiquitin carboxyl-terminal hydrolase MINDY n=1 Tax=Biomphalaria pfeifferi TaxID=112525 RepID=A0AAD8CC63_BIOPF|nr:protein FAM188B [Biomphalaria pfeifferi]
MSHMISNSTVEAATASLVREYLSRKGLKATLKKMDIEYPRDDLSINNRQLLMKHVHLEKIMKRNKEENEPLKSMLEVMTKNFMADRLNTDNNLRRESLDNLISPPPNLQTSKTNLASNDLIVDDDIEGECLTGAGKAGLFNVDDILSPPLLNTKKISSKKLERITPNNTNGNMPSRNNLHMSKPTRLSVSQQEQIRKEKIENIEGQKTPQLPVSFNEKKDLQQDELSSDPLRLMTRDNIRRKDNPVSFEALLIKGEERANSIKQMGLEKQNKLTADQLYKVETSSIYKDKCKPESKNNIQVSTTKVNDLEFGDVDDVDLDDIPIKSPVGLTMKPEKLVKLSSSPLDLRTAMALKTIVLGSPTQVFIDEWMKQSLTFSECPDIKYGLVQKKGGPCGVLAAIQANFLQELLFGENRLPHVFKNPSRTDRSKLLAIALSHIFWRAGNMSSAVVTLPSETTHLINSSKFKQDGITERLSVFTFSSFTTLSDFMIQSISEFESEGSPGVVLTMYSAILSRKVHLTRADFDDPDHSTLIGNHGYCTQELVNLLLTGQAVSNVFNDIKQLDGCGIGDTIILKGLSKRSDLGFLTLLEHYQSCEVGTFYKTPKNPIWVICSESHFSVMFATKQELVSDWRAERIFDLYYYDGLANQQEEIRLTINTLNPSFKAPKGNEDELVPPLEHCIRTKWTDAEIDWNGSEPIL